MTTLATPGAIRCGHCSGSHDTVGGVRACGTLPPSDRWACDWLVEIRYYTEDGPQSLIQECGALAWLLRAPGGDERGSECERGHSHVHAEYRLAEGWEYAEGDGEADALAASGVEPRDLVTGGAYRWGIAP